MRAQFAHDSLGGVDGNRKADVLPAGQDCHIDADDSPFFVHKRPPAVSRIDRGAGLYHTLVRRGLRIRCRSESTDHSRCESVTQPERVADGHHLLTDLDPIGVSQ